MIGGFLGRIHRPLERPAAHTGMACGSRKVGRWLKELGDLHRDIGLLGSGKGMPAKRRSKYRKLPDIAAETSRTLRTLRNRGGGRIGDRCIAPPPGCGSMQ